MLDMVSAALVPAGKRPSAWTDERVEELKRGAARHKSCAEIADAVCLLPGPPISRNAVIGKLSRLGLSTGNIKGDPGKRRKARGATRPKQALEELSDAATELPPDHSEFAMTFFEAMASDDRCRYPLGNSADLDEFRFCGAKLATEPYCARHHKLTHKRHIELSPEEHARRSAWAADMARRRRA